GSNAATVTPSNGRPSAACFPTKPEWAVHVVRFNLDAWTAKTADFTRLVQVVRVVQLRKKMTGCKQLPLAAELYGGRTARVQLRRTSLRCLVHSDRLDHA